MSAFCQYFPVLPLFGINEDIILLAAFCRHNLVSGILPPVFLLAFCQHFVVVFSSHLPPAYCQHHYDDIIIQTM